MGRFRIQLLLEDNTWHNQYTILKNDWYIDSDSEWTLFNLTFTVQRYGIKLIYDKLTKDSCKCCNSCK